MDMEILNKKFSDFEKRIILIFYARSEGYTARTLYDRLKGEYRYEYISLTLVNLASLKILKKYVNVNIKDKRKSPYILSDEYKELGKKISDEEEEKRMFEKAKGKGHE